MPRLPKLKYILLGVLVVIAAFAVYFPSYSRYRELKIEAENLDEQVENLQKQIQQLQIEKQLIRNDKSHLESVIRKELGLVEPGEVVYEFGSSSARKPSQAPAVAPVPAAVSSQEKPKSGSKTAVSKPPKTV